MKHFLVTAGTFLFIFVGALGTGVKTTDAQTISSVPSTPSVTLVWEAGTETHPLYPGKALYTEQSDVRLVAFPPRSFGDPALANYTWTVNQTVLGDKSGVGRRSLEIKASTLPERLSVLVEVEGANGQVGYGLVRPIPTSEPVVLLYENSPLTGIRFDRAFSENVDARVGGELALEAVPLFFSRNDVRDGALSFLWRLNGDLIQNPLADQGTLVAQSDEAGTSTLSVLVKNKNRLLQYAETNLSVISQ